MVNTYLKGINFSGNLFSQISFSRNFAEKRELIFTDFRGFISTENLAGTHFRGQQKSPNKKPPSEKQRHSQDVCCSTAIL